MAEESLFPATHAGFKAWYGASRKAFKRFRWMRDTGPFHGIYFTRGSCFEDMNGLFRGKHVAHPIAQHHLNLRDARRAFGKNYKRMALSNARAVRTHCQIEKRLP